MPRRRRRSRGREMRKRDVRRANVPGRRLRELEEGVNPTTMGQPATFTAAVAASAPGAGTPDGMVTFLDGRTLLQTVPLQLVAGMEQAAVTVKFGKTGRHLITAVYHGATNFIGSLGTLVEEVV